MADDLYKGINTPDKFGDLLTTTSNSMKSTITEKIYNSVPTLSWMRKNASEKGDYGAYIEEPIQIKKNLNARYINPNDTLNVEPAEIATKALFEGKILVGSVTFNQVDKVKNSGKAQVINMIKNREKDVYKSMVETQASSMYATNPAATDPNSLFEIVSASNPSRGNLGMLDRSTTTSWQAKEASIGSIAGTGVAAIDTFFKMLAPDSGDDFPKAVFTTSAIHGYLINEMQGQVRTSDVEMVNLGFRSIDLYGVSVFFDSRCPAGYMLALNPEFIKLKTYSGMDWDETPYVKSPLQIAYTKQIMVLSNLVCSAPNKLGLGTGVTA